jgi:SOS response associated peptidase (SRAP)
VKIACSGALDGRWILIWVFSFETRPAFREAFQRRRCLVPVDGFCEWKKPKPGKQPYAIALADRGLMVLAGLWENWRSPAANGCAASLSSPPRRTSCAPSFITACQWSLNPTPGQFGWERSRRMHHKWLDILNASI